MVRFNIKFVDIMVGVILGFGFSYWPQLHATWQYIAFIFIYLDIVDYWVDYEPFLRKFSPRKELDIMLDVAIAFLLFLCIFSVTVNPLLFLIAYAAFMFVDLLTLFRVHQEYKVKELTKSEKTYVKIWTIVDLTMLLSALILFFVLRSSMLAVLWAIIIFIILKLALRIYASFTYRRAYFV